MSHHTQNECPVCSSKNTNVRFEAQDHTKDMFIELSNKKYQGVMNDWYNKDLFKILKCENCSHLWHFSYPANDDIFKMYSFSRALKKNKVVDHRTKWISDQLGFTKSMVRSCTNSKDMSFLDYGSGLGYWSAAAKKIGFDVVAYEPSTERSELLRKNLGVKAVNSLNEVSNQKFDLINLEQVLEHVPNPLESLKELKKYCHHDTIFRITVPNTEALLNDDEQWTDFPFKNGKVHLMSPYEHLHGFNKKSLKTLISEAGLKELNYTKLIFKHPLLTLRSQASKTTVYASALS